MICLHSIKGDGIAKSLKWGILYVWSFITGRSRYFSIHSVCRQALGPIRQWGLFLQNMKLTFLCLNIESNKFLFISFNHSDCMWYSLFRRSAIWKYPVIQKLFPSSGFDVINDIAACCVCTFGVWSWLSRHGSAKGQCIGSGSHSSLCYISWTLWHTSCCWS